MRAKPLIEAHRGASDLFPENTMAAFQAAVDAEADSIELDVHQTLDDHWVVMHDATVDRTTNGSGAIAETTFRQIRTLDCGSWKDHAFRGEQIPALDEAVRIATAAGIGLNVEIKAFRKSGNAARSFVAALRGPGVDPDTQVVSSFNLNALLDVRRVDATIALAILGDADETLQLARTHQLPWMHAKADTLTEAHVKEARRLGIQTMAWTVDSPELFMQLSAWGLDKICTNRPTAMRRIRCDLQELRPGRDSRHSF